MPRFFNRIRKQLAKDNKFFQYYRYAFGEIILVMVGILLALQIDNWNERRKNTETELLYYCRIYDDLKLEKELINEFVENANHRIATSKELLLDLESTTKDKNYLLNKFLSAVISDTYIPRNETYKDLVFSGNLKLLNDVTIKSSLIQYNTAMENKQSQLKEFRFENFKKIVDMSSSSIEFGMQEFFFVNQVLEPEIIQTLPNHDWTKDKNSRFYKEFQSSILFNILHSTREKMHLSDINDLMDAPYKLLERKCEEN